MRPNQIKIAGMDGSSSIRLLAPAKINLFLHVVGRRPDGYHLLESAFELIDWFDQIELSLTQGPDIQRQGDLCSPLEADLAVRAARALQATPAWRAKGQPGAVISVAKAIPSGAGLGGGSSDAATTLIGLNRLWGLGLSRSVLADIGLSLGADLPFFLSGLGAAFIEGVGERLSAYQASDRWLVVAVPSCSVATGPVFQAPELTRDSKRLKIADFAQAASEPVWEFGRNDLEPVTMGRFSEVHQLISWLKEAAQSEAVGQNAVRMSGSGGAVFCTASNAAQAQAIFDRMASKRDSADGRLIAHLRLCKTLARHPEQL